MRPSPRFKIDALIFFHRSRFLCDNRQVSNATDQAERAGSSRSVPRTARERARAEITGEILDAARGYLATDGAPALSLRAIARDLGMASSALYRYFKSRDELLTRLIIDAYDSLGAAAEVREATIDRNDLAGRFTAICDAVRAWALAHPNEYALIYGSPVPGYVAPADTVPPATRVTVPAPPHHRRRRDRRTSASRGLPGRRSPIGSGRPGPDPLPPASSGPRTACPASPHGVDGPVRRRLVRAVRPAARGGGGGTRLTATPSSPSASAAGSNSSASPDRPVASGTVLVLVLVLQQHRS